MSTIERKAIMIRLTPHNYSKLEEMKKENFIKNYARFCEKAIENALDKKYQEFSNIKNQKEKASA